MISFDDFQKLDLRVASIISAERIEGSDKLLKLMINIGDEERQLVAGIGRKYSPEELEGKQIVVIANLEPRELMGLESQGMLLAADGEQGSVMLIPDHEIPPGAKIR